MARMGGIRMFDSSVVLVTALVNGTALGSQPALRSA